MPSYAKIDVYLAPPSTNPPDRSVELAAQCACALDALRDLEGVLPRIRFLLEDERPEEARALLSSLMFRVNYLDDILRS